MNGASTSSWEGSRCSRVVTVYNLYRVLGNIDVYTESKLLEVKVPLDFLGTVGFSLCREERYYNAESFIALRAHNSSIFSPACLKCPLALRLFPPTTSIHYSKKALKPCSRPSLYICQCRLIKAFNSAKNSSIGFRSGKYRGKYTSFIPALQYICLIHSV